MSVFVIIPTYNERENIAEVLLRIFQQLPKACVVVADDASPDGTGDVVRGFMTQFPDQLFYRCRSGPRGYGPACVEGIQFALAQGAQKIIGMDADLSHPPEALSGLLELSKKYDLVLGSRYISGGATPDWPFSRRLLSRSANFYARTILAMPIRDITTGFRCFDRRIFERVHFNEVRCIGYGFLTEIVYRIHSAGFSIGEFPIVYRDRTRGQSKMGLSIAWEGAVNVLKMRLSRRRVIKKI